MGIGAYTIAIGNAGGAASGVGAGVTVCERGSFSVDVLLRSVILTRAAVTAADVKPVVYTDAGALVAAGPVTSVAASTAGTTFEVAFSTGVALTAGATYRIGCYESANVVRVHTLAEAHAHASSPAGITWTETNTNLYYKTGDVFPTTAWGAEMDGAFTLDLPAPATNVSVNLAGAWQAALRKVRSADAWLDHNPVAL